MADFDVILSSGGSKGMAFMGAVEVLQRKHRVRRVIGTSAGAIGALFLAAGYTAKELIGILGPNGADRTALAQLLAPPDAEPLKEAMRQPDSEIRRLGRSFLDTVIDRVMGKLSEKLPRVAFGLRVAAAPHRDELRTAVLEAMIEHAAGPRLASLASFLEFGGFYSSETAIDWLSKRVATQVRGFTADWTLAQLFQATGRDVTFVTADTTEKRALFLNHRTAPDCPAVQAVRMSLSIPLVWQEIVWPAHWGKYLNQPMTGHVLVDGAAMLEMPLQLYLKPDEPMVRQVMGPPPAGEAHTIGLLLDDQIPPPGMNGNPGNGAAGMGKLDLRIGRLVDTLTRWEQDALKPLDALICRIPTQGFSALEFEMSQERFDALINSGRCAMTEYLTQRKFAV
ncbi:patatin-like phospholipase family protein [Tuwongella immobilis]|uniref:PNPLA domain-containing protein n=1 Tax=Tuwongella immobilis TaxID=692036 RepID=A0A6C2YI28_9BACT|nr:patatin-like phospholipase family protein [Tuwongella immobilis]VIP00919.1 esterase of the alpha-beta hydrolase superfamily : Putative esterase of the alpha-beta hydrolase superfamily OS=Clostridium sp. BNL1100 GN=Clo1100_1224 PE=4 SV=1: Patatin [Tuwongella immobilis]VTR97256.1 esterase of the alpha-beta hydrolase superfamily : Putative esterase of the alpha-beta hydrolase superfamily OS=Clostridium sp. BNL1100 GN=Clo1100_1224 PE=4 SV=1: Patatin [Tuwongella immobilis]